MLNTRFYFQNIYPDVPDQNDPAQQVTSTTPYYHDITVENLTATNCNYGGIIIGLPETPMTKILLSNVKIFANTGLRIRDASIDTNNVNVHVNSGSPYLFEVDGVFTGIESGQNNIVFEIFKLFQNYPNPFNPTTIISYQLPQNNFVTLDIYDVSGRKVMNLVNEQQKAGNHALTLNASNLSSGVYFYRIESGSYKETKKFVLIK
jgi:Secretion system C-terminal sorting domain